MTHNLGQTRTRPAGAPDDLRPIFGMRDIKPIDHQPSLTLTIPQAAALLGISTSAAYEFARRGDLPTVKLGTRVLVSRRRLEEMIDGQDAI